MIFRMVGNFRTASVVLLAALGLTACPGPGEATLTILEPLDGAELNLSDDTNDDLDGVQIDVRVEAIGVAVGEDIEILVDGRMSAGSATVPDDGNVLVRDVTIPSGAHTLEAVDSSGDVRSPVVNVVIVDSCFAISFVTPIPAGSVTLGPEDDTDGLECGETFETSIVVSTSAPDGSSARVFVNGTPRVTAAVSGGAVRFEGVAFDNRGSVSNDLSVEITDDVGVRCGADFPSAILVDCAGVSCTITAPETENGFLSQAEDVSDAPGFQGDFAVTTDTEGAGQAVRLIVDGNETDALSAAPDGMTAAFGNVSLSEGVHRVQGECRDDSGNITRSGVAEWTVDTVGCAVEIVSPEESTLFIDSDDLDDAVSGIQIDAAGTAASDCSDLRVAVCSGIDGAAFASAETSWISRVTLGGSAMQALCAQSRDPAGNLNTAMVGVRVQTAAPQLEIATPVAGAAFNIAGGGGRTADLDPSTGVCDATFQVLCTGLNEPIELVREDTGLELASAPCDEDATAPSPYTGRATFTSVPLPSQENGTAYNVFARQTVDRLTGTSSPISLRPDCIAPLLSVVVPSCGAILRPSDDQNTSTPELELRTGIQFPNGQSGDPVTLTIGPSGGSPTHTETRSFATNPVNFVGANYGSGGSLDIVATATDAAGNAGTSAACAVTVADLPTLMIDTPVAGAVLGPAADCSGDPGFQLRVQGMTDAPAGSSITVTVGAGAPASAVVGAGGAIDVCTSAADGRGIPVRVEVTDPRGTATATVAVTVDTMAPGEAIDDLVAAVVDRRAGVVRLTWTAVADAGGLPLSSYALRCAATPITNETEWAAAQPRPVMVVPGSAGSLQSVDADGFRTGQTRHCVLRGVDPAGGLTPLATSTSVVAEFLTQSVAFGGSSRLGNTLTAIGDVNNDGFDDVLSSGTSEAYLYFGSASPGSAATLRIIGAAGWNLQVAGIGDFNGDATPDFALGAREWGPDGGPANRGAVFLFYGRDAWPATIMISTTAGACSGASVCFVSDDGAAGTGPDETALLGAQVSSAGDFDGDGLMDIAMGAPFSGGTPRPGRVYVILGSLTQYPAGTTVAVPGTGAGPDGFFVQGDGTAHRLLGNVVRSLGGDLDGDGRHDILIQSNGNSSMPTMFMARVTRMAGRAHTDGTGLQSVALSSLDVLGSGPSGEYGLTLAAGGDVDGDGNLDALVADRNAGGFINIHFGARAGFAGGAVARISNDLAGGGDQFGLTLGSGREPSLGNVGDLDRDGRTDIVTGALAETGAPATGDVFYSTGGRAAFARSARDYRAGPAAMGLRAAWIGDVNGDGYPDIAVGDPDFMTSAGRFTIHY